MDVYGNLYVANYGNDNILKVNKRGEVSILLGNVKKPYGLYLKGNMLFVSSQGSNSVIRYKLKISINILFVNYAFVHLKL